MKKRGKKRSEQIVDALSFPKEVILSTPCIKMLGDGEVSIENYGGIVDFNENNVSFATAMGIVEIRGEKISIKSITDEDAALTGKFFALEIKEM